MPAIGARVAGEAAGGTYDGRQHPAGQPVDGLGRPRTVSNGPPRTADTRPRTTRAGGESMRTGRVRRGGTGRRFGAGPAVRGPLAVESCEAGAVTAFRSVSRSLRAASNSLRAYRPVTRTQPEPARRRPPAAHISGLVRR